MAGVNQIFTIVAFALLVVLVLGLGLLVAILVQRRRAKRLKAAAEVRREERRRAAAAGVAGLHEDTETSGGISLLGLSVQEAVPDAPPSRSGGSGGAGWSGWAGGAGGSGGASPWAPAPRPPERAAWLSASVQQASGAHAPRLPAAARTPGLRPQATTPPLAARDRVEPSPSGQEQVEPSPSGQLGGHAPGPHRYGSTFSGGGTAQS